MKVKFEYNLTSAGWADSTISNDERQVKMQVSYLSDSLGDLTKAMVDLLNGAEEKEVFFMDEPGEHRLLLRRTGKENLLVEVEWFEDWKSWELMDKETKGEKVFSAEVSLLKVAHEVKASLDKLLEKFGVEGYKKKWIEHEFPLEPYERLKNISKQS